MSNIHAALYLLLSAIATAWTVCGVLLIRSSLPGRLSAPRALWMPIRLTLVLLQLAGVIVLVLVAPPAVLLLLAPRVDHVVGFVGCGLWLYSFGAIPFASAPFENAAYRELSAPMRRRYRLPVIVFGAVLPASVLGAAALGTFALSTLPIPGLYQLLNSTPDAVLVIPFVAAAASSAAIGGYAGYRCWRLFASLFLPSPLVSAIARPKRPDVGAELAKAESHRTGREAGPRG